LKIRPRPGRASCSRARPARPAPCRRRLSLPAGAPVIQLSTLSAADGVPVSAATSWFDASRFAKSPIIYAQTGSITASLARLGVDDYTRKTTAVEARHASSEDLDLLALSPGAIVLLTRASTSIRRRTRSCYGESRFAADRVELLIDNRTAETRHPTDPPPVTASQKDRHKTEN
jgi:GntR family phosphonate transport system transcriptional regulator